MKLNVLKWIYNLGYERATDRYYYNLMERVQGVGAQLRGFGQIDQTHMGSRERDRHNDMIRRSEDLRYEMQSLINEVFHPTEETVTKEAVDRFGPEIKS